MPPLDFLQRRFSSKRSQRVTHLLELRLWRNLPELLVDLVSGGTVVNTPRTGNPDEVLLKTTIQIDGDIVTKVEKKAVKRSDLTDLVDRHMDEVRTRMRLLARTMDRIGQLPLVLLVPSLLATGHALIDAFRAGLSGASFSELLELVPNYALMTVLLAALSPFLPRILRHLALKRLAALSFDFEKHDPALQRKYVRQAQ